MFAPKLHLRPGTLSAGVAGHNILFLFGLGSCNILLYQIDGLSDIPRRGGQRYYGQAVVAKAQWSFQFPS